MEGDGMDVPERFWICPTCRGWSGKAGHIGCTGPDGKAQPEPVECAPADQLRGVVEALRAARDELGRAPVRDRPTPTARASKIIGDALDRFGGQ